MLINSLKERYQILNNTWKNYINKNFDVSNEKTHKVAFQIAGNLSHLGNIIYLIVNKEPFIANEWKKCKHAKDVREFENLNLLMDTMSTLFSCFNFFIRSLQDNFLLFSIRKEWTVMGTSFNNDKMS